MYATLRARCMRGMLMAATPHSSAFRVCSIVDASRRDLPPTELSMARLSIFSDRAPRAIGPYSQAVRAGNTVYLSGQIPLDPKTGELVSGDFALETRRVFDNLKAVAEAAGDGFKDVVRITVYLTDLADFPKVN